MGRVQSVEHVSGSRLLGRAIPALLLALAPNVGALVLGILTFVVVVAVPSQR